VLLVLTLATVITGKMHLPGVALGLALVIASTKGLLVLLFFMHLIDHKGANRLVMGVSILFVLMMLGMPMADLATRFRPANPSGSKHLSDLPDLNFIEGISDTQGGGHEAPSGH
jgi:cytochrome c oxidase subunit 4